MTDGVPLLSTAEAAARLGVKPATLYAYVSRGLISRVRGADGRASFFDPAELDQMAQQPRSPVAVAGTGVLIPSAVSEIREQRLWYRGLDACEMARTESFEAVAGWLWTEGRPALSFTGPAEFVDAARAAATALPPRVRLLDRIRAVVAAVGAIDPLRADLRPEAVTVTAASLIAAIVDGLPPAPDAGTGGGADGPEAESVAGRLWGVLTGMPPQAAAVGALNTALGLLADHGVTASTVAARVAASARAHPYAAVGAALYTLDGSIESGTSALVHRTLVEAESDGSVAVVARLLDQSNHLPGFDHPLYPDGDPRGRALIDVLAAEPPHRGRWEAVEQFLATGRRGRPLDPTLDFGVAALTFTAGMPSDAGLAILAVARCAGWIAHTLEEYAEEPDRFRPPPDGSRRRSRG
ncbi:citrate synthase [Cryptosporangium phraense]|uniref:citrate synthase (unknown stereospecificity) n=1 Tax=Cryptosporangium phraense TaxID=2593070 RepID=A0A545AJF4_9ACTN|nr:citrate synthase [Cryptosporangium phraense]TQS41454.1 helix-turn-helix domain-containing protein [Cryptosporangium phraense]